MRDLPHNGQRASTHKSTMMVDALRGKKYGNATVNGHHIMHWTKGRKYGGSNQGGGSIGGGTSGGGG